MPRAAVIGAGIGGLSFIAAMRDHLWPRGDWKIDLVERADRVRASGVGIVLHPNGLEVLAQLGIAEEVCARGNRITDLVIHRGENVASIGFSDVWNHSTYPTIAIRRSELFDVLFRRAVPTGCSAVSLQTGAAALGVELSPLGPVVAFEGGRTQRYDLVIGADGLHSVTRQSLFEDAQAAPTGIAYYRYVAANDIGMAHHQWTVFEDEDISWGFIPISGELLHCFVQERAAGGLPPADAIGASLRELASARDERISVTLERPIGPIHAHMSYLLPMPYWGAGQCVLLGDAAHVVSPTLSQGGSLALADALALSKAIGSHRSIDDAVSEYTRIRNGPTLWAHRMSLAQVNAIRKGGGARHVDSETAAAHLRCVYERFEQAPA